MKTFTNKKAATLAQVISEKLNDGEFKVAFENELEINRISKLIYDLRIKAGLSQIELAQLAHTTQPVIARLEKGTDSRVPSLGLLFKLASAVDKKLTISIE